MPPRVRYEHPALAGPRTELAWSRTGLALLAAATLSVRVAVLKPSVFTAAAAGAVVVAAFVGLHTASRARFSTAPTPRAQVRALTLAVLVAGCAAAPLVLLEALGRA